MKKFALSLLVVALMILMARPTFAAVGEEIMVGENLGAINRLAVAMPNHNKDITTPKEPNLDELLLILDASAISAKTKNYSVISCTDIAATIRQDTGVDLNAVDYKEANKVFDDNIAKYADAYVVLTTANSQKSSTFFFEVRNAQTGDIMYNFITKAGKDTGGYTNACTEFFRRLDLAVEKQRKASK